ncbi:hypothetical protein [Sphingobium sp. EM0848]|uniref:hypothetical protein n=1 Tax=Sphingobium sp. EM0848 TaxID=2743473 RepID=UPI00159BF2AC|nr:hypothetical protein [Sphingobium sp. EM0848]
MDDSKSNTSSNDDTQPDRANSGVVSKFDCAVERQNLINAQVSEWGIHEETAELTLDANLEAINKETPEELQKSLHFYTSAIAGTNALPATDGARLMLCLHKTRLEQSTSPSRSSEPLASQVPSIACAAEQLGNMNQEIAGFDSRLDDFLNNTPNSSVGASGMLAVTMWALKGQTDTIRKYCPDAEAFKRRIANLETSFNSAQAACDKIRTGGGKCTPISPEDMRDSIAQAAARAANAQTSLSSSSAGAPETTDPTPGSSSNTRTCERDGICTAN